MAYEWIANVGARSAHQRVAHLICEMGLRLAAVGRAQDNSFEWPMTQIEVADATGLSAIHVNRVIRRLRADGLIELTGKTIKVGDWDALQNAGEFKPDYLFAAANGGAARPDRAIGIG